MHSEQILTFKKLFGHLHTVRTHRKWVRKYCRYAGIWWRGIIHDLSKYSPTEFFESARYWDGKSSPIPKIKKDNNGISRAWQHHKGRNMHHYEYWMDNFDGGGQAHLMPQNDFVEMVCDMLAASATYNNGEKTFQKCNEFWKAHKERGCAMNKQNQIMLDIVLSDLEYAEANAGFFRHILSPIELLKKHHIQAVYNANKDERKYV